MAQISEMQASLDAQLAIFSDVPTDSDSSDLPEDVAKSPPETPQNKTSESSSSKSSGHSPVSPSDYRETTASQFEGSAGILRRATAMSPLGMFVSFSVARLRKFN